MRNSVKGSGVSRASIVRAGLPLAAAVVAVFAFAAPASAHVTVSTSAAVQGGYAKLTFRVPNEKADASTVAVEVNLPPETPIASVSVKPVPGWTAVITKSTLAKPIKVHDREVTEAASKIVWTASAGAPIAPGQFQEFDVSAGPLPEVDKIVFKALQTYSDGDIVRWIEERSGDTEPDHPAPVLTLTKAAGTATTAPAVTASSESDGAGPGVVLGAAGVVLGLAGLVVGLLAYRKVVSSAPASTG